jgi:hypothetical protein
MQDLTTAFVVGPVIAATFITVWHIFAASRHSPAEPIDH